MSYLTFTHIYYLLFRIRRRATRLLPKNSERFSDMKVKKGKVKCTLVQALRLRTGRTAHRGSRSIALLFHDLGTRRR
jgi:hypothetical protein